jgi:hypothetical protein
VTFFAGGCDEEATAHVYRRTDSCLPFLRNAPKRDVHDNKLRNGRTSSRREGTRLRQAKDNSAPFSASLEVVMETLTVTVSNDNDIATAEPALACSVCEEPALGVASSCLGAVSFSFCRRCCLKKAEPEIMFDYLYDELRDGVADWVKELFTFKDGIYWSWGFYVSWRKRMEATHAD